MPHVERMGYRSFTIYEWMWSDRGFCNELLAVARGDAIFLNRDHPLSEQKDDLWKSDPAQKGRNHADEWAQKVREGKVHTPLDRTYFLGLNEPDSHQFQRQIDAYNEAYCRRLAQHGLRGAAYSFGVGQPSTVGLQPDTLPDWSYYAASAAAVLEGDHIAAFHEYGEPNGYGWGYWCNRAMHCPYPFQVVLDECGIDHGVLQAGYLYGWAIALKPEEYLRWLDGFQLGMAERARTRKVNILAYNIFSYDHGRGETKDWHSFDIRPLRPLLEAYRWSEPATVPQPTTTHIPAVSKPQPATVPPLASGIIEPRTAQAILKIESGGRTHGDNGKPIIRFEAHIFKTYLGNDALWAQHFRTDANRPWVDQMWRQSPADPWRVIHTGKQSDEYSVFEFAASLHAEAAHKAISVGAAQIMGFNHARIGYASAQAMYSGFQSAPMQTLGFINFCLSDRELMAAIARRDWREMAKRYNGPGNVDTYAKLLQQAYEASQ